MTPPEAMPMRFFDPAEEALVVDRRLPHWSQPDVLCFITWRTWDSIPAAALKTYIAMRDSWLRRHDINPLLPDWQLRLKSLPQAARQEFHNTVHARWQDSLDACHGACVLREPQHAQVVADSLHHFDGDRYLLTDFVVMPNHVHLLAAFPGPEQMLKQCESWKHFTAVKINRALKRSGRFWQFDGFDHLLRSEEQFQYLRDYIEENPRRARLKPGEFIHYRRELVQ